MSPLDLPPLRCARRGCNDQATIRVRAGDPRHSYWSGVACDRHLDAVAEWAKTRYGLPLTTEPIPSHNYTTAAPPVQQLTLDEP